MIYLPAEDSFLLARNLDKYVLGKTFLDMGAGSGIQSEAALEAGAKKVVAVDIDEEVIRYLKNKGIEAIKSDLFTDVMGNFDVIAFNPPYLPTDAREDKESAKATSGGKRGDEIILSFLDQVIENLAEEGVVLLVISSLTPSKKIEKILRRSKLKSKIIDEEKLFMEKLFLLEIHRTD